MRPAAAVSKRAGGDCRRRPQISGRAVTLAAALAAAPALAIDCAVPASRATVQQAIADPACTRILLATQTFGESVAVRRPLEIVGADPGPSTLQGSLDVMAGAPVVLTDLEVSGCAQARIHATGGAQVAGAGVVVATGVPPCPIFADAFESGNRNAWSSTTP